MVVAVSNADVCRREFVTLKPFLLLLQLLLFTGGSVKMEVDGHNILLTLKPCCCCFKC
jgi:hypothetical protein